MEQKGLRTGHFLALLGAVAAVVSLWRPWYRVEFPPEFRDLFSTNGELGRDPGLFGQLARGAAAMIPDHVTVDGWTALDSADVVLTLAATVVAIAVLAASGAISGLRVDARLAANAASLAGTAVLAIALWHVVKKPGGSVAADWLHLGSGVWIACAGGAAMLGGGLWASAGAATASRMPTTTPSASLNTAFPPLTPDLPPVFAETSIAPPGAARPDHAA